MGYEEELVVRRSDVAGGFAGGGATGNVFQSEELVENRGDTVTTLKIEKRTKNQIYLMGGADYRITVDDNPGLCRYLKVPLLCCT